MRIFFTEHNVSPLPVAMRTVIKQAICTAYKLHNLSRVGNGMHEVSVSIVSSPEIQALNKSHRNKDSATDVLSFPAQVDFLRTVGDISTKCEKSAFGFFIPTDLCSRRRRHGIKNVSATRAKRFHVRGSKNPQYSHLGDIIICIDIAMAQAYEYGHCVERELAFLAAHGFLHLIGYDHECAEDEAVMIAMQKKILSYIGE